MEMNSFEILLTIVAIFFAILFVYEKVNPKEPKTEQPSNTETLDFTKCYQRKNLLTKTEYVFYGILKKKCDDAKLLICPKVRLEDFISVTASEKARFRGYIKARHIDFLICDSALHILAAIELDDPSHSTQKAQKTDNFKNQLYQTIGIPLWRIQTGENYNQRIDEFISNLSKNQSNN